MPGYYGGYYGIDMYYIILVLPAIVFALWAQAKVNGTFRKYSQVRPRNGMTGAQAAEAVLRENGVTGIRVEHIGGNLTDHFDPREGVIRLSDTVYNAFMVAVIGVAAHEAGHAAQYANSYTPIKVRNAIIPVSRVGSTLSWPLLLIGLVLNSQPLVTIGILFFLAAVIFQLVTLPVEFNASTRAIAALADGGYLTEDELPGARKTLSAAAMTYVAALAVSLAQLLRLVLLFGGGRRRD